MFLGNPKPDQIWLSLTLPLNLRRWTWWGKESQLWELFLSSWPQISTYPQYCLLILFLWSLHLISSEMTLLYLLLFPQSPLSPFFSFLVNDLSTNSIWENSNSPKRTSILQLLNVSTGTQILCPTSCQRGWTNWVHLNQPLCLYSGSHLLWPNQGFCSYNYPWSLLKHLLPPALSCNTSHSRKKLPYSHISCGHVLIFLLFARQNLEKNSPYSLHLVVCLPLLIELISIDIWLSPAIESTPVTSISGLTLTELITS